MIFINREKNHQFDYFYSCCCFVKMCTNMQTVSDRNCLICMENIPFLTNYWFCHICKCKMCYKCKKTVKMIPISREKNHLYINYTDCSYFSPFYMYENTKYYIAICSNNCMIQSLGVVKANYADELDISINNGQMHHSQKLVKRENNRIERCKFNTLLKISKETLSEYLCDDVIKIIVNYINKKV